MSAKQYSRIFEKIDKNPDQYKKFFASIYEQVSAENFDVIQNIIVQIHDTLANQSRPQSKMFAVRLFKDLLPAASYGFMLYSKSYLINQIIKIIEFKIKGRGEDYQKYLFSTQPDTNLAQIGRSTYAMALESLKFAAETMTLHPYQRISFPSIFRLEYNRLSSLIKFPQSYKFIPQTEKVKFSSNYNAKIKNIKSTITSFQNRLNSRMSFCLSQGNFEIKSWLVKFLYTGESNIIPYVLNWVAKQIQNPQINSTTKGEMMDFLNEVFVIGDIQIMNQFNNNIIPVMLQIFKIITNNQGISQNLRRRAKQCLSFWGQISPESSQLLQCFSQKAPLLQGSRLYQSYSSFSQALELNIAYRNQININKQKFLTSKNMSNHLALLTQFYSKYPTGNQMIIMEEKIVTHTFPNVPITHSEQFGRNMRTSDVVNMFQQPSQSAINQLSMPGNSYISKPSSAGGGFDNIDQYKYQYPPTSQFNQPPIINNLPHINIDQLNHLNRSKISFSESNISNRIRQLENMNRQNGGSVKFMDQVEVMNYEVHNQDNPKIYLEKRNLSSHISSRPAEEMQIKTPQQPVAHVFQQIQFHDSYANPLQQYQMHSIKNIYPTTPAHQYYQGEDKEYIPSQTIIKTVSKPEFKFPVPIPPVIPVVTTTIESHQISQYNPIRRVQSTHYLQGPHQPLQPSQFYKQSIETPHDPYNNNQDYYNNNIKMVSQKTPILFSRADSSPKPNKQSLLKRSQSSSVFNGALFNLNQSLRLTEQRQFDSRPFSPRNYTTNQYEQRIKVLENEVQTCLAVDQIHKQQMQQLKQQLYDVNNKVQHIASLQTYQPPQMQSIVVKHSYQQPLQQIQIVQSIPPLITQSYQNIVHSQQPAFRLPKQIQLWNNSNQHSTHLNIPPIRMSNRRKRQLMRNKQVLHKTNECQVGFIMILKDYLQITIYYYFSSSSTQFKTQLNSPDLKCLETTNFSYIPYVEAGTQKKQTYRFSYPKPNSLPFSTPQIIISYISNNNKEQFKCLLPCIILKFLTTIQKHTPQGHFNSYHSSPFIINPLFQRFQNIAELLPGLLPLSSSNNIKQYGVQSCYLQYTVYIKLIMFRDSFCMIQLYELRIGSTHKNLIGTIMEDLISVLSTDL